MGKEMEELADRLESIGWGLLLLLFAAVSLPHGTAEFVSVTVVGLAMVGLNVYRRLRGLEVAWFSLVLGLAVSIAGVAALRSVEMDVFALFFVVAGVVTIGAALVRPVSRATQEQPN